MKLKCKMAGKKIVDDNGEPYACVACKGILVKSGKRWKFEEPVRVMYSFPREPAVDFTCPMLTESPEKSELVEVIEGDSSPQA